MLSYFVRGQKNPRRPSPFVRGTTWTCRCGWLCDTFSLIAMNAPCAESASCTASDTFCTKENKGAIDACGSEAKSGVWARGTTNTWPLNTGRTSRNAHARASRCTMDAASVPSAMAQNRQLTVKASVAHQKVRARDEGSLGECAGATPREQRDFSSCFQVSAAAVSRSQESFGSNPAPAKEKTVKKALIASMTLMAACGGSSAFKDQARDSLPNKSTVGMNSPDGTSTAANAPSTALTAAPDATSSDPFFALTVSVAATFNVPVKVFLDVLADVAAKEPASCTETSCTWGPGSSALDFNTYELVVSRDPDGESFDWTLSAQAKSRPASAFVKVASGVARPSGTPHHGSGSFTMDFDAAQTLDGTHDATGKLNVTSYSNVGPAQLAVTYTGAKDANVSTETDDIAYAFAEDAAGGGDLQFALRNTTTANDVSVHSRWKNDGSGRADVQGSAGTFSLQDSDCWGPAPFAQVYFTSTAVAAPPPFGGAATGSVTSCAFSTAVFSALTVQ